VRKRSPPEQSASPVSLGTLGDVLARRGIPSGTPAAPEPPPAPAVPRDPDVPDLGRCGKVVVRRERKGHGGKTATIVAGIGLPARELERVARALRHALGCGASVDGDRLVVQGDQAPRVQAWLGAQGARRVALGN
jgi:translation initiation factor 1